MMDKSYYFDPTSIDGSDKDDEEAEVSLDNWKPSTKSGDLPKSQWRQLQNKGNHNLSPGRDELRKIQMYLKKNYPHHQIMDAFGISSDTMSAIVDGRYSPIDGIAYSDIEKITKKFNLLDKKIGKVMDALELLLDIFPAAETSKRLLYKTLVCRAKKKTPDELEDLDD